MYQSAPTSRHGGGCAATDGAGVELGVRRGSPVSSRTIAFTAPVLYLIAGGSFDQTGGQPAANIARWNGSAWSALPGGGPDGTVFSLLPT